MGTRGDGKIKGINEEIKKLEINSKDFTYWLKGFITGEGSFYKRAKGEKKEFRIEQVDRKVSMMHKMYHAILTWKVMELVKERLGLGPLVRERDRRGKRERSRISYEVQASSKKDIKRLIEVMENGEGSLLGNKLNQYKEWKG